MGQSQANDDVLWQKVLQSGIGIEELEYIAKQLPNRLAEAWDVFKSHAKKNELHFVIRLIPALRQLAWDLYRPLATFQDLMEVAEYVDEAWQIFASQATPNQIAAAMFGFGERRQRQAWEIVRRRGQNRDILHAFQAARETDSHTLCDEIWRFLRNQADRESLRYMILHGSEVIEKEAWEDLRSIAHDSDLVHVIECKSRPACFEAAELLLQRNPSLDNLLYVVKKLPLETKTVRRWFRQKSVAVLAPAAITAINLLLEKDLTEHGLFLLRNCAKNNEGDTRELLARIAAKEQEIEQSGKSPVLPLLKQLKKNQ